MASPYGSSISRLWGPCSLYMWASAKAQHHLWGNRSYGAVRGPANLGRVFMLARADQDCWNSAFIVLLNPYCSLVPIQSLLMVDSVILPVPRPPHLPQYDSWDLLLSTYGSMWHLTGAYLGREIFIAGLSLGITDCQHQARSPPSLMPLGPSLMTISHVLSPSTSVLTSGPLYLVLPLPRMSLP